MMVEILHKVDIFDATEVFKMRRNVYYIHSSLYKINCIDNYLFELLF
jgi:hypothetical protein